MQNTSLFSRFTRTLVVLVTILCLGIGAGIPRAQAVFGVGDTVAVVGDLPRTISETRGSIWSNLVQAGVGALFNAMQLFLGQLAYDAANYIASGGKGQSALFYKKGFLGYMQDVGGDAVGDFVGSLSTRGGFFSSLGINLCQPRNPALMLRLQTSLSELGQRALGAAPNVGVNERFQRPRPRCQLQEIVNNYDNLYETMSNTDVLRTVASSFDATSNELGTVTSIYNRFLDNVQQRLTTASQDRQEGGGYNSVQGIISGTIRTPAALVNQATDDFLVKQPATNQSQLVGAILNNAWNIGAPQLLWYTASIFTNTLVSKLLKNVFEKGIFSSTGIYTSTAGSALIDSVLIYGKTDARNANISLKDVSFFKQVTFDAVTELNTCPTDGTRSLYNCTIDQGLFAAISAKSGDGALTVGQAVSKGYLHLDWQLIPDTQDRINTSPTCYSTAYCSGNIKKLRSLRILSAGFEFAANSPTNIERCKTGTCVTLQEVMDGYATCNSQDQLDETHPWCHLIDPNWIITSLPQQCQLSGYGDQLLSEKSGIRREQCADVQTCLRRDENGQCIGGYGSCVAERSVYRFQGDSCPARYASCRTYTARNNTPVSYLRYSVDRGQCSADNVGCLWYATQRLATAGRNDDWLAATTTGPRIYFDKNVESCADSAEGCTKLYGTSARVPALNLLQNPSFERAADGVTPPVIEAWKGTDDQALPISVFTSSTAFTGNVGLQEGTITARKAMYQKVSLVGGRTYTVSLLARVASRSGSTYSSFLFVPYRRATDGSYQQFTPTDLTAYYHTAGSCELFTLGRIGYVLTAPSGASTDSVMSSEWRRFECTMVMPPATVAGDVIIDGADILVDAVQLEEGEYATDFIDGLNQSLPEVHVKVAPDELNCSGSASDHQLCAKFAQVCRQSEAGCQGYTDITAGGAEIPAILSSNDTCPSECVGYAQFRKSASAFDLVPDIDTRFDDPQDTSSTAFIASTAQLCSQADVGCEAFTALDGARTGQTLTYNYLRACELPDSNSETFFTWEGADTTGYQLRTWSLKHDTADSGPRVLAKLESDQLSFKEPQTCNEALWRSGFDPDCRQFYNADGRVFYRYFSQTVLSTNDCTQLRYNGSNSADCIKTGGTFNAGGECVYKAVLAESRVCRAEAVSCRRYLGSGSGDVQTVYSQDFRASTTGGFLGTTTTEALLVGDASLRMVVNGTSMTSATIPTNDSSLYRVTFWAKSPATTTLLALKIKDPLDLVARDTFAGAASVGSVQIGPEWQRYTLGLFSGIPGATSTSFGWITAATSPVFFDEVVVSRVQDVVYVKKDSWSTPISCDRSPDGADEPQAMLGCRSYRDRTGTTVDARRFTRLCRETAISCRGFVDTRNSEQTGSQTFMQTDTTPVPGYPISATTIRGADRYLYLIDTPDKRCNASDDSCRAFGRPNFAPDRNTFAVADPFTTVYLKDDIAKYDQMLCKPSELFCESYNHNGQTEYFRDPQTHQCEYREGVSIPADNTFNVPAGNYNGWFQLGLNAPCYPQILTNGNTFGLASGGDDPALYAGWVGTCPAEQSECTEFRDPNDTSDPTHKSGRPYFLIRNDKIDTASCNGSVDQAQGCVLFRDLSDSQTTYSTRATYEKYKLNNYKSVTPVDCVQDGNNPLCQGTDTEGNLVTNNANLILKVGVDRDCAQWLGCKSSETVFDAGSGQYRTICTDLALCDAASTSPNDIFCAHYIDRSSTTTEPILSKGAFFDAKLYSSRKTGLGTLDYSGYALPDAFQVSDVNMTKVGVEGALDTPENESKFANEYRLAAVIHMPPVTLVGSTKVHIPASGPNEAHILDYDPIGRAYPNLHLCQHNATGRIGYYLPAERDANRGFNCYLSVSGAQAVGGAKDPFDFTSLQEAFSSEKPKTDRHLMVAFPPSECRSYPEEDSPYANEYVSSWDLTKNPPKPTSFAQGYNRANFCEYGEDCSCTYKRAQYGGAGGASKFFGVYSSNVPPGICQGGPREGQSCIPSTIFKAPSTVPGAAGASATAIEGSNAAQTCGPPEMGGRCVSFDSVSIVRGNYGACLERDTSTNPRGAQISSQCLTWNPNPFLFGVNDPYHFIPTSGYLPPQNSGQYYCLSPARDPKTVRFDSSYFVKLAGTENFAGKMTKMDFDDKYLSEGGNPPEGNEPGADLYGLKPAGTSSANACESTDDDENGEVGSGQGSDSQALRLISDSRSADNKYIETFFPVNAVKLASSLSGVPASALGADYRPGSAAVKTAMYDDRFGNFMIYPIKTPNGTARLGCGYQADWVDNAGSIDYDEIDQVKQGEQLWLEKFNADYQPSLNRGSEEIIIQDDQMPLTATCVNSGGNGATGECYFKAWSTSYHVPPSEQPFQAFSNAPTGGHRSNFTILQQDPYHKACAANKPYFSIRAVFQASAALDAQHNRTRRDFTGANSKNIVGPWSFVGFWVTTCGGKSSGDVRYMYMYIEANTGDICRDLAEVVSRDSHQDAAFTDRVAKDSTFTIPQLGIQYNSRYAPFSSALNTGPAGSDPLFQSGQEIVGYSPVNPPTFLAAGLRTYSIEGPDPKQKWAYLSNIFARIYRVYHYEEQAVTAGSTACLAGPFKGKACQPFQAQLHPDCAAGQVCDSRSYVFQSPVTNGGNGVSASCSLNGICDPNRAGQATQDQNSTSGYCNSLSGINTGKTCVVDTEWCHIGYIRNDSEGRPAPRTLPCITQPTWTKTGETQWTHEGTQFDQQEAADAGAFRCPNTPNSIRRVNLLHPYDALTWNDASIGQKCYQPTDTDPSNVQGSYECPERIWNGVEYQARPPAQRVTKAICKVRATGAEYSPWFSNNPAYQSPTSWGRCDMAVPSYDLNLPNGGSFHLEGFNIDYTDPASPSCTGNYDCSFTNMNYYYDTPGGTYPHDGGVSLETSYYSYRSMHFLRPFYDNLVTTYLNDAGTLDVLNPTLAPGFLKSRTVSASQLGPMTALPYNVWPPRGRDDDCGTDDTGCDAGEYATTPAEISHAYGAGAAEQVNFARRFTGGGEHVLIGDAYKIGACIRPTQRAEGATTRFGKCVGGLKDGNFCQWPDPGADSDFSCLSPLAATLAEGTYGEPVEGKDQNVCGPVTTLNNGQRYTVALCNKFGVTSTLAIVSDPTRDDNLCTHPRGYVPRIDLCPNPSDEFCGLIAYNQKDPENSLSPTAPALLPTDVTQGLHTPNFLGLTDPTYADGQNKFDYISVYAPHPPVIAAPDSSKCTSPGHCELNGLNAFSLNGQSEGPISIAGGQFKANVLFYAWAAHNQMPLRAVYVDWGDSSVQQLPDARMKNHKPLCNVKKECTNAAGLTCDKNADCPPGAGTCEPIGVCKIDDTKTCHKDSDCGSSDSCNLRTLFGNTPEACEENYFDFTHLYTCNGPANLPNCGNDPAVTQPIPSRIPRGTCFYGGWETFVRDSGVAGAPATCTTNVTASDECVNFVYANRVAMGLPSDIDKLNIRTNGVICNSGTVAESSIVTTRCSRDPARLCQRDDNCAPGDSCIEGLAPPGGCWDSRVNSCRFTPRVKVIDNWGWCTGECRSKLVAGVLTEELDPRAPGQTAAPVAKHPYGGCYSGMVQGTNRSIDTNISPLSARGSNNPIASFPDECGINPRVSSGTTNRPWIVYPGSINLRSSNNINISL